MIADIAIQFATVFVGAYLAFAAEELRQRRQTRNWARTHLRHLAALFSAETPTASVATDLLRDQLDACDAWLRAGSAADLTEEQWDAVIHIVAARAPDLGSLLRGEPVALLPAELALGLAQLEALGRELETANDRINGLRERILPLWAGRRTPLSDSDKRIVMLHRSSVVEYADLIERTVASVRSVVTLIEDWVGVRH